MTLQYLKGAKRAFLVTITHQEDGVSNMKGRIQEVITAMAN